MTDDTPEIALVQRFCTLISSNRSDAAIEWRDYFDLGSFERQAASMQG